MKKFTLIDLIGQTIIASIYIVLYCVFIYEFKDIQFESPEILLSRLLTKKLILLGVIISQFARNVTI